MADLLVASTARPTRDSRTARESGRHSRRPALPRFVSGDLLLYHCVHRCKHRLTVGFRAFCDTAEIVRRYGTEMDWNQFLSRASEWRVGTFVYVPLRLAGDLLGAPVPAEVFRSLASEASESLLPDAAKAEVPEDRSSSLLFPDLLALLRQARWPAPFAQRINHSSVQDRL